MSDDNTLWVENEDFELALKKVGPSVSPEVF